MTDNSDEYVTQELPILKPIGSFASGRNDLDLTHESGIQYGTGRFGKFAMIPAIGGGLRICTVLDESDENGNPVLSAPIGYVRKVQTTESLTNSSGTRVSEAFEPVFQVRAKCTHSWYEIPNFASVEEAATALRFVHEWALAGELDGIAVLSVKHVNRQISKVWPGSDQEPQRYRLSVLWRFVLNNHDLTPVE